MAEDTVRVLRIIEFTGERGVVEAQIIGSLKDGTHNIREGLTIKVATVGSFPEILEQPNAGS